MTKTTFTGAAVALLLTSVAVYAQPHGGIMRLDSDGDGQISRDEFRPPEQRRGPRLFERADLNDDGSVTRDEVITALDEGAEERRERMQEHMLAMFDAMDEDGNGVVTESEALDHAFARVDANGDGYVTEAEAEAMHEQRRERRSERRQSRS